MESEQLSPCRTCRGTKIVRLSLGRRTPCPNCDGTGTVPPRVIGVYNRDLMNKRRRGWRKLRSELGLCNECGSPVHVNDKGRKLSRCKFHFDKAKKTDPDAMRIIRQIRRDAGLCTECKEPTPQYVDTNGERHALCQRHHGLQQNRMAKFNKARKASGTCYCGDKVKPGRTRCTFCLENEIRRQQQKTADRRALNLCTKCGDCKPQKERDWCRACLKLSSDRYHEKKRLRRFRMERRGQLSKALGVSDLILTGR